MTAWGVANYFAYSAEIRFFPQTHITVNPWHFLHLPLSDIFMFTEITIRS